MVIFVDYGIYAVLIFMFIVVGCQFMRVININIVDFQNIKNIKLRITLKSVNVVTSGNIKSDPSPYNLSRPTCRKDVMLCYVQY